MMEYAVTAANVVISKNRTVSHTWMLMRRRKPASRPSRMRSSESQSGRRTPERSPRRKPLFSSGRRPFRFGRSFPLTEDIPHTPGGVDELRVPRVAFYLFAQVADVYVHRTF